LDEIESYNALTTNKLLPSDSSFRIDHLNILCGNIKEAAVSIFSCLMA